MATRAQLSIQHDAVLLDVYIIMQEKNRPLLIDRARSRLLITTITGMPTI